MKSTWNDNLAKCARIFDTMLYEKFDQLINKATEVIKEYYGEHLVSELVLETANKVITS